MKYYVQTIARNYLKKLPTQMAEFKVHPVYLQGLTEDEFKDGYAALVEFMRELYTGIINNPADFKMPLKDIPSGEPGSSKCSKSHARFVSIPRLLLAIGSIGVLGTDMTLYINGGELNKKAKLFLISNTAMLFQIFEDYGFEITGASKKINDYDEIKIEYPDCRTLTAALKSFCEAQNKIGEMWHEGADYFYMMTPKLIESETPKIKLEAENLFHYLSDESREIARTIHDFAVNHFRYKLAAGGNKHNIWRFNYTGKKTKKVVMQLKTRDDRLTIAVNLENITEYKDEIMPTMDYLHNKIRKNGYPCTKCYSKCADGFVYEMDGIEYNICREPAFSFYDTSAADIPHIKILLELKMRREE